MFISFIKSLFKRKRPSKHPNMSRRGFLGIAIGCGIAASQLLNPVEAKSVVPIAQQVQRLDAEKRSCLFCKKKTIEARIPIVRCPDCFCTGLYR